MPRKGKGEGQEKGKQSNQMERLLDSLDYFYNRRNYSKTVLESDGFSWNLTVSMKTMTESDRGRVAWKRNLSSEMQMNVSNANLTRYLQLIFSFQSGSASLFDDSDSVNSVYAYDHACHEARDSSAVVDSYSYQSMK